MSDTSGIREHMEIIGADDAHIGTVDHVDGGRIKLTKTDRGAAGQHHYLPVAMVDGVEGDKVRMSFKGELVSQFWETDGPAA
ncbi:DUF2171 domain-containing protein [Roseomonas sp. BN140053]|uniref:DUF2171 domain-containing protein n=1 Tax=Roseomonas sp. BN140053 TaxID=3391898 RepID=UPI0039E7B39E